jgi:hypothetical protein
MNSTGKVSEAIAALRAQGHRVEVVNRSGKLWCELDRRMLATMQEMEELADGVFSLAELEELYVRRRALEAQARELGE